jgi:hypothetical protein
MPIAMQTRTWSRAAAALLMIAAAAAGADAQPVVRVAAADRALAAPGAPLFAVGRADGRDWEAFGRVAHVAFDRADNLYVLDQGNGRVVVLDPRGRFVRQFGRRGRGPGEMIAPMQLAVTHDGSVVVADVGQRAFAVFSPEGEFRNSVPFPTRTGVAGLAVAAFPGGGVITVVQQLAGAGGPGAEASSSRSLVWKSLNDARPPVTLFRAPDAPGATREGQGTRTAVSSTVIFAPRLSFGVFPSGALAVAHTADYRIAVTGRGPSTPTARFVERPLRPRRVTAADRERMRELQSDPARSGVTIVSTGRTPRGAAAEVLARRLEGMPFADVIPVIEALAVDGSGRLWVQRAGREVGTDGPIDLLTEQGGYLGTVSGLKMPAAFGAGRAAWIEADALGVQRVVVRPLPAWR